MKLNVRKKASQERSKFTVDSILKATWDLLNNAGDKANMTKIAERSGVSVGSIYQYFPSLDSVVLNLMERVLNDKITAIDELLTKHSTDSLDGKIRIVIDFWVSCVAKTTTTHYFAKKFMMYGEKEFLIKADMKLVEVFKKHLAGHMSELRKEEVDLSLLIMVQTIRTIPMSLKLIRPKDFDTQKCIDELTDLAVRYLKKT